MVCADKRMAMSDHERMGDGARVDREVDGRGDITVLCTTIPRERDLDRYKL